MVDFEEEALVEEQPEVAEQMSEDEYFGLESDNTVQPDYSIPQIEEEPKVDLISDTGALVEAPESQVQTLTDMGYRLDNFENRVVTKSVMDSRNSFLTQLANAGFVATDSLLLGIPEIIADKVQDPLDVAVRKAIKADNPITSDISTVAGIVGSIPVGGPLWKGAAGAGRAAESAVANILTKGAEKVGLEVTEGVIKNTAANIVTNLAKNTAKYGTEGVAIAAPQALTESVLGDTQTAGETLAIGGILGGGLGAVAPVAGVVAKAGAPIVKGAGKVLSKIDNTFTEAASAILSGDAQAVRNAAFKDVAREVNQKIGLKLGPKTINETNMIETGQEIIENNLRPKWKTDNSFIEKLEKHRTEAGEAIGKAVSDADNLLLKTHNDQIAEHSALMAADGLPPVTSLKPANWDTKDIYKQVETAVRKKVNLDLSDNKKYVKALRELRNDLDELTANGATTFKDLNDLKVTIGNAAFPQRGVVNEGKKLVGGELNEALMNTLEKLDIAIVGDVNVSSKGIADSIKKARKSYEVMSNSIKSLNKKSKSPIVKALNQYVGDKVFLGSLAYGGIDGGITALVGRQVYNSLVRGYYQKSLLGLANIMEKQGSKIDGMLGNALSTTSTAVKNAAPAIKLSSVSAMNQFIGENNKDKKQTYDKFSQTIGDLTSNVSRTNNMMAKQVGDLTDIAPETASAYQQTQWKALTYLQDQLPKSNRPQDPFNPIPYVPNDEELSKYNRKVSAVMDPFSIVASFNNGTLTKEEVEAVKTVYPKVYESIVNKIMEISTKDPKRLDYNQRSKLSLLTGVDITNRTNKAKTTQIQQVVYAPQEDNAPDARATNLKNIGTADLTPAQKMQK